MEWRGKEKEMLKTKIEVFRLRSLCLLLSSCLHYIVFYYFINIHIDIYTYVLIRA